MKRPLKKGWQEADKLYHAEPKGPIKSFKVRIPRSLLIRVIRKASKS